MRERLDLILATTSRRAAIVIGRVDPGCWGEVEAAIRASVGAGREVILLRIDGEHDGIEQLRELNAMRDLLVPTDTVVALLATSPEGYHAIRRQANDLTISPSLTIDVRAANRTGDWPALAEALRAWAVQHNATLDLTGLIPGKPESSTLALRDVYMDLVPIQPDAARSGPRRWLILGNPGAGKTTALRHMALVYGEGSADPLGVGGGVPVLVPLADYGAARQREIRPLKEFILSWLSERGLPEAGAMTGRWAEVVLLLDGLDELREAAGRREVLAEIARWKGEDAPRAVVISGRMSVVDDLREGDQASFEIVSCRGPDKGEIRAFVQRVAALRDRPGALQRIDPEAVFGAITSDPNLSDMAATPLLLIFLVILWDLDGRLPERRIELYYRMGELLVDRWTRARSMAPTAAQRRATRADALRVLGPLAVWAVERQGAWISPPSLLEGLTRIEAARGEEGAERRARTLLDLLERDTAILVRSPSSGWAFVHRSLAEYFAAIETCRDPERWRALLANPFGAASPEVVTFAAGYLGVIHAEDAKLHELAQAVLRRSRRPGRYGAEYAILLMDLIQEQPGLAEDDEQALITRLGPLLFENRYSGVAMLSVHHRFLSFSLSSNKALYAQSVRAMLQSWPPERIRWDRMLDVAPTLLPKTTTQSKSSNPNPILRFGVYIMLIRPILQLWNLDWRPYVAHFCSSPDPRLVAAGAWLERHMNLTLDLDRADAKS